MGTVHFHPSQVNLHPVQEEFSLRLKVLEVANSLTKCLTRFRHKFHLPFRINFGIVTKINKAIELRLEATIHDMEQLLKLADEVSIEKAKIAYPLIESEFRKYRIFYSRFEVLKFARFKSNRILAERLLDLFYEVEFKFRLKAYSDTVTSGHDEELKEAAINISLNAAASFS